VPVEGLPEDPEILASFADLRFRLAHRGHSELQTAVRDELLAVNPAARIKQPGMPRTGGHHLCIAEVAYPPVLRLLVAKGLRPGQRSLNAPAVSSRRVPEGTGSFDAAHERLIAGVNTFAPRFGEGVLT
jgi:hypothetical protein